MKLTNPQIRMLDVLVSNLEPPMQHWKLFRESGSGRSGYRVLRRLEEMGLVNVTSPSMKDDDWVKITREGVAIMMGDR